MPNLLPFTLIAIMWMSAALVGGLPFVFLGEQGHWIQLLTIAIAPLLFIVTFAVVGGLVSRVAQKGIKRGKFPREAMHEVYLMRRIYGACWTQLFYFKPAYSIVLAIPFLKKFIFRLYGYKGACDFTVYPDTWLRDLPVLDVGSKAYLSNRSTIGTNICLADGSILVDAVRIAKQGLVGHLAMLGPGVKVGEKAEIGVGCGIGIRVHIKDGATIRPSTTVNHGCVIGKNVDIGTMSFIGLRCEIADNIKIPAGANIPAGVLLTTQDEVNKYYSSETETLNIQRDKLSEIVKKHFTDAG